MAAVVAEPRIRIVQLATLRAGLRLTDCLAALAAEFRAGRNQGIAFVAADHSPGRAVRSAFAQAPSDGPGNRPDALGRPLGHVVERILDHRSDFLGLVTRHPAEESEHHHRAADEQQRYSDESTPDVPGRSRPADGREETRDSDHDEHQTRDGQNRPADLQQMPPRHDAAISSSTSSASATPSCSAMPRSRVTMSLSSTRRNKSV